MTLANSKLTLLLPGLFGPIPSFASCGVELSVPLLERVLARADSKSVPGADYLTTLYALFGYTGPAQADLPQGAVNYLADGGDPGDFCYMRADPVHLRPDRDRLLLFDSAQLAISGPEAETLAGEFNQHFAQEGIQLLAPCPGRWYLRLAQCPQMRTRSLVDVVGHHIESFMPSGADARVWRRLSNEMQMLLFQSPINQQRESEGRLTINGIWLSGVGKVPAIASGGYRKVFAEEPAALGLAQIAGVWSAPVTEFVWPAGEECLLVLTDLVAPILHADPYAWAEALQELEIKLAGLLGSMPSRRQSCLEIYPCNGGSYTLTTSTLRRFWRRTRKFPAYMN